MGTMIMNINVTTNTTDKIQEQNAQTAIKQSEKDEQWSFSDEYKLLLAQNGINLGVAEQNQLYSIMNLSKTDSKNDFLNYANSLGTIRSSFNYDTMTISKDDALFFCEMVEKNDYITAQEDKFSFKINLLKVANDAETQNLKSVEVSKVLMNLIEDAYKTQKPVRIDFDNNVAVILRISKDGKLSAEFIPGDNAVEKYLKENIGYLKNRLEEQNIDYGDILYKPYKDNSKQQRNNRNSGGQK